MTTYFIDSENVQNKWGLVVDEMESGDIAVVSYSDECASMPLDCLDKLLKHEVIIEMSKCYSGNNAMDFQISTDLGFRIARNEENDKYVIVSNDHGYDPVVRYWSDRKIAISRKGVLTASNTKKKTKAKTTPTPTQPTQPSKTTQEVKNATKQPNAAQTAKTVPEDAKQQNEKSSVENAKPAASAQNPPANKKVVLKKDLLAVYREKAIKAGVDESQANAVANALYEAFSYKGSTKSGNALAANFGSALSKLIGREEEKKVFAKMKGVLDNIYRTCPRPVPTK